MSKFLHELEGFIRSIYVDEQDIALHRPYLDQIDDRSVLAALNSGFVSSVGPMVTEFEQRIGVFTGAPFVIATSSGTAALHLLLVASGVQRGDEVLTQSISFVATSNAIAYCGAKPVFLDIDRRTLGMCPESLEGWLEENARVDANGKCRNRKTDRAISACVPTHNNGNTLEVKKIASICEEWRILLIEDAAESLGSTIDGIHTGLFGIGGALSFNGNKVITTGGGGAVLCHSDEFAQRIRHLSTTAKKSHPWLFLHDDIGFNYRMPNINAALGVGQIKKLPLLLEAKREIHNNYATFLMQHGYTILDGMDSEKWNYWFNCFYVENVETRNEMLAWLKTRRIMCRPIWSALHKMTMYRDCETGRMDNSTWIEDRLISLPSSVPLNKIHSHES